MQQWVLEILSKIFTLHSQKVQLPKNLLRLFMGLSKKKIQNGRLKKLCFSKPSILNIFSLNWVGLVLGLMQITSMWLNRYGRQAKNAFVFLACFRPYVGQPDNHIGWVTLMPFASIYHTDLRTNPAQSSQRFLGSKDGSKFWWLHWFPAHEVLGQHLFTGL